MRGSRIGVEELARLINKSNYTVVLLGTRFAEDIGIALPSPEHPSLWRRLGRYLTPQGLAENPGRAWGLYRGLYEKSVELRGSPVYRSLRMLVEKGFIQAVATASIDGVLSSTVRDAPIAELGGSIARSRCMGGSHVYDTKAVIDGGTYKCPHDGSPVRPDIVLYGEDVPKREWVKALVELSAAELVVAAGVSPLIKPYNILPLIPRVFGATLAVVDDSSWGPVDVADYVVARRPAGVWRRLAKILL